MAAPRIGVQTASCAHLQPQHNTYLYKFLPMMLFHRHQRVQCITTLLHGPSQLAKNYAPKRHIAYDPTNKMSINDHYDTWCLEYVPPTCLLRRRSRHLSSVLFRTYLDVSPPARYIAVLCMAARPPLHSSSLRLGLRNLSSLTNKPSPPGNPG